MPACQGHRGTSQFCLPTPLPPHGKATPLRWGPCSVFRLLGILASDPHSVQAARKGPEISGPHLRALRLHPAGLVWSGRTVPTLTRHSQGPGRCSLLLRSARAAGRPRPGPAWTRSTPPRYPPHSTSLAHGSRGSALSSQPRYLRPVLQISPFLTGMRVFERPGPEYRYVPSHCCWALTTHRAGTTSAPLFFLCFWLPGFLSFWHLPRTDTDADADGPPVS